MPLFTAAAVTDTISKLRSKIAVYRTLMSQLRANYLSSDAGPGELRIQREDGAFVTDSHLTETLEDLEATINDIAEELDEWENLTFSSNLSGAVSLTPVEVEESKEEVEAPSIAALALSKQKRKETDEARRTGKNQPRTK